jgi:gamma-glutamyltranspeptidase/glutathione hydrolase
MLSFNSNRSPVLARRGMVASSQPLATQAGLSILMQGGNAADAAVATAAALGVTEPYSTGLGGDCFALYYEAKTGKITALNGSGRTPAQLSLDLLTTQGLNELPPYHAHTATVPGTVAGWCDFIEKHGSMPLAEILAPAIYLAEEGFPVAPITAHFWREFGQQKLKNAFGGPALLPNGVGPQAGEIFVNKDLARTMRLVAEGGKEAFYRGEIAQKIVRAIQAVGGVMTAEDLARHTSTWEQPISTLYRGVRVWECPPNGQGLAALLALNVLEDFDLSGLDPLGLERWHLLIEAMRVAFADTAWYVCDPQFFEIPLAGLLSKSYAHERCRLINPLKAMLDCQWGVPVAGSDTVYFCAVDGAGNACSFINSISASFGTGIVPAGLGFALHNRGAAFSLDPQHPNALAPDKRPYHTIIPGLLTREEDGSLYGPFGVMADFMQPQGHLQIVVNLIDDRLDPQAALDRPRFRIEGGRASGIVLLEKGLPPSVAGGLALLGHQIIPEVSGPLRNVKFGLGQIIRRDPDGVLWGGSDPRGDGCAMGF